MSIRDFAKAATCFFDTMATFTSTELMDYRTFVKYACFCCVVALGRSDVKTKVSEAIVWQLLSYDMASPDRSLRGLTFSKCYMTSLN